MEYVAGQTLDELIPRKGFRLSLALKYGIQMADALTRAHAAGIMSDRVFVDANVLVYAHDLDAGERHAVAARLVAELWGTRGAIISTQVLHELYVNAMRKILSPLPRSTARQIVRTYTAWQSALGQPVKPATR
jgi:hypothetical protein